MGVSKSKEVKLGEQQTFQTQFPGQQGMQAAFGQASFPTQQQLSQQMSQQLPQQMSQQLAQQLSQQGFGQQQPSAGGFSSFPPFPPMPQQQGLNNLQFPNLPSLPPNAIFPSNTSSAFPVQFGNQQLKPLIPGYAPAPDRRAMMPPQSHDHEQNEFSMGKYYVDQQVMPGMQGMPSVKARKH